MLSLSSEASPFEVPSPIVKVDGLDSTPCVIEIFTLLYEFKVNWIIEVKFFVTLYAKISLKICFDSPSTWVLKDSVYTCPRISSKKIGCSSCNTFDKESFSIVISNVVFFLPLLILLKKNHCHTTTNLLNNGGYFFI